MTIPEIVSTDPEAPEARSCLAAYYADLARLFETGFDVATSLDPQAADMRPPRGAFFVARVGDAAVGCVGLKGTGGEIAEIKRLWVAPAFRGCGLARRLMTEAETAARALTVIKLRLDTNRALTGAMSLYRAMGWQEVPAFNEEPYAHHWFEKRL